MKRSDKATKLLDSAQKMACNKGYNGFSFRDLAADIGVQSSTVHYYFPTKELLGQALAKRYSDKFLFSLGKPEDYSTAKEAVDKYTEIYFKALVEDKSMCLFAIMGAEFNALPTLVKQEAKSFFRTNIEWLEQALRNQSGIQSDVLRYQTAVKIISTLQGAMIISQTLGSDSYFEAAASALLDI